MNSSLQQQLRSLFGNTHRILSSVRHIVRVTDVKRSFVNNFSRQVWQYGLVMGIQAMHVQRVIEARSRNHCWRGKAKCSAYSECVFL